MPSFIPKLIDAEGPVERMDALCEFIDFWIGPRKPEYGVSAEVLNGMELPMPLRKLYEFAGNWPPLNEDDYSEYAVGAFSTQDCLTPCHRLEFDSEGRLKFVGENQGNWDCTTETQGLDPPVHAEGDLWSEDGDIVHSQIVCDSLSAFLTTFVLQEIALGSKQCLCDEGLKQQFEKNRQEAVEVWGKGPYVNEGSHDFWLWRDVLVAQIWDTYFFSTNHSAGLEYLSTNQGAVSKFEVMVGETWRLNVHDDGSARIVYWGDQPDSEEAAIPSGTFPFHQIMQQLLARVEPPDEPGLTPIMFLFREGQSGSQGQYVADTEYVTKLFAQAVEAMDPKNAFLEKQFQDWLR